MSARDLDFVFVERGTPEWHRMWAWLAAHPLNKGLPDPDSAYDEETGEAWQYMDTEPLDGEPFCWAHVFRHRHHPKRKERVYLRCGAPLWTPPPDTDTDNHNPQE